MSELLSVADGASIALRLYDAGQPIHTIAPPGAQLSRNSLIRPAQLGKIPTAHGEHGAYGWDWVRERQTRGSIERSLAAGFGWGIRCDNVVAFDIDSEDLRVSDIVNELMLEQFESNVQRRTRPGSNRFLIPIATVLGHSIRKRTLTLADGEGTLGVIELLATGNQFVCVGIHKAGSSYQWDTPFDPTHNPPLGVAELENLWTSLKEKFARAGIAVVEGGAKATSNPGIGDRAPSVEHVRDVVRLIPNAEDTSRVEFVGVGHAIKAAVGSANESDGLEIYQEWCARYPHGNDPGYVTDTWRSLHGSAIGYDYLRSKAGLSRSVSADEFPVERASPSTTANRRHFYTLRDWMERPELLTPPEDLLPHGLAIRGRCTLLSSREKAGKSTLIGQGVAAFSNGGRFLGEDVKAGRVLQYTLDEPTGDTVRRLVRFGANPDAVALLYERPTAADLRNEIAASGASIVLVDTLSELWTGEVKSANDSEEIGRFIRPYIEVIREAGVALTLLHHTTKAGTGYRGGIQLGAVVDVPLSLLRRPATEKVTEDNWDESNADDGRRVLLGKGRGVSVDVRLSFDGETYTTGTSSLPLDLRILRDLELAPASGNAVVMSLKRRRTDVMNELRKLETAGKVQRSGHAYALTDLGRAELTPQFDEVDALIGRSL